MAEEKQETEEKRAETSSGTGVAAGPLGGPLDEAAVRAIYGIEPVDGSFEPREELGRNPAEGVLWRRRRAGWKIAGEGEAEAGQQRGLCVNELRVGRDAEAGLYPDVVCAGDRPADLDAVENSYWQTVWAGGALRVERGEKLSRVFLNMAPLLAPSGRRGPDPLWVRLAEAQQRLADGNEWRDDDDDALAALRPVLREVPGTALAPARYLPAHPPSASVQGDERVLAATNAGYFLNFPEEYDDGRSALHQPVGALFADGTLHMPPWIERPCAVEFEDGERKLELLAPENLELELEGHKKPVRLVRGMRGADQPAQVWRHFDGPVPPGMLPGDRAVDLVFCGPNLVAVAAPGAARAPIGGAVVRLLPPFAYPFLQWLKEPAENPLPRWRLRLGAMHAAPVRWALAAGPMLVAKGEPYAGDDLFGPGAGGEFRPDGPPPTRFPYDAAETRAPRTALGLTEAGDWVLAVVDGRADPAHSVGATLEEMARLMAHLGCREAMNLDGGGSSVMVVKAAAVEDQLRPGLTRGIVSLPSDPGHRERIVPVAITLRRPLDAAP